MSIEVVHIIEQISREKGIKKSILVEALESAMEAAFRKKLPYIENMVSEFNESTGEVDIFAEKTVVESPDDTNKQINLKDAKDLIPEAELGDNVLVPQEIDNLGRIAAQLAKQVILQKVREAEIEIVFNEFKEKKGLLINGIVQRVEHGDLIVDLGKVEGVLPRREQVFRETFNRGERIRAYILDVRKTSKNTIVILSRTHVGLIKNLFELEVPEISEGMVEIMGIVREPNGRTKIAVRTNDRDIDAVGACVGMRGLRVQSIVQELRGEKIDIVEFSEEPEVFIRNALSPAKISRIVSNKEGSHMTIIVADDQMSLAIGKKGQNVRLAAKLVKWRIDIKGESDVSSLLADTSPFGKKSTAPKEDFLNTIKEAKGFGEKIVSILFSNDVVTFAQVTEMGVEGLIKLSGIGPKKAEALLEFTKEWLKTAAKSAPEPEVEKPPVAEAPEEEEEEVAAEEEEAPESTPEEEETEEQEFSLDVLKIDTEILKLLESNDFQTVAEISVTPLEELTSIEGIDESVAQAVLDQARQYLEKYENA